jgi:CheY-like chemotaxis protein
MNLESLLLSRDAQVMRVLRPMLGKLSIEVEICQEAKKAVEILIAKKFDAVIVDCDDLQGGLEILQGLRGTPSNKNSASFAILNGKKTTTQEAFDAGASFVLQKPVTTLNASRCFHAALNFMERERRRYYRQPVAMPVQVIDGEKKIKATSTNISEGGIALVLQQALPKNATPHLQFTLPGTSVAFDLESEISWADIKGRFGLRFRNVEKQSQEMLERWLNAQLEKQSAAGEGRAAGASAAPAQ